MNIIKPFVQKKIFLFISLILAATMFIGSCSNTTLQEKTTPAQEKDLNILFIGNSLTYANDMPGMLERMLEYAGVRVKKFDVIANPNFGLPDHWMYEATRKKIEMPVWDVVVLQQGPSATEGRPYLLEYSKLFSQEIKKFGAQTALYMVWPSQQRYFDFDGVSDSYKTAAELVDGMLFPAGEAWRKAWDKDPNLELYGPDGFHPSQLGSYLAALVMFEQLSGQSLDDLPAVIMTAKEDIKISEELARLLKEAAHKANADFAR